MEEDGHYMDEEKIGVKPDVSAESASEEVPSYLASAANSGILGTLRHYETLLDRKLGVEAHGISRKLPEERDPSYAKWSNQAVMYLLWMSATLNLSCFTTGFLGGELGLDLTQTIAITCLGTFAGSCITGWCATLGPGMGLRQVSISRYSIGWWPSKVIAVLNVIEQIGWSSVGCITGGLALSAVSDGRVGSELGVAIAAIMGFIISFVGLKAIFQYEKFAGLVLAVVFIVMWGETASFADYKTPTELTGATLSGTAMTLFAVVYGSSASWCSIVADYYVEYPVRTSKVKVFVLTTLGITLPTCFGMCLGCIISSALANKPDWNAAYGEGVGFLIQTMIHPYGLAKFLLVILALSGISMNAVALYSAGLSVQQFARPLGVVPRFVWTTMMFVLIILLAIVGRDRLLVFLEDFLSLLGYWNTSFFVIIFVEHHLFRGGHRGYQGYNLDAWNTPSKMPIGLAGGAAFFVGVAGWIIAMDETWFVGPVAARIGAYGGDLGNQLSFAFTLVVFIPARYLEYKFIGR